MSANGNGTKLIGGLLGLHALTSLHPGSGTALGTVDLPVQRERHTQWPNIAGSALKGILRDAAREVIARETDLAEQDRFDDNPEEDTPDSRANRRKDKKKRALADATVKLTKVFGPPSGSNSEHAGAISITDARIIAYPVRSLKGLFAWVTCPGALQRLQRDASVVGMEFSSDIPNPKQNTAIVADGSPCLCPENQIILEEYLFSRTEGDSSAIGKWLADHLLCDQDSYQSTRKRLPKHLVILSDDDFSHFVSQATEIVARVALDYESKTAKDGALFYQEFLPAECLFYSVVIANAARTRHAKADANEIFHILDTHLPSVLQVGGDETTGKGFCSTKLSPRSNGQA